MTQASKAIELDSDDIDNQDVEVPEQLIRDYQELNKKLELAIVKIHKRKTLIQLKNKKK